MLQNQFGRRLCCIALKVQQLENHQKLYQEQVTRNNQQWHTYEKRIKNLQTEQRSLHAPKAEQDQELQKMADSYFGNKKNHRNSPNWL